MFNLKNNSIQRWLTIQELYNDGIIKLKNGTYIKIIKIIPINYELKTEFEKKTILNSYRAFLKNCNFNIQIIIQSNREDLSNNIKRLEKRKAYENSLNNTIIVNLIEKYINFIKQKNLEKLSSSKNFYILIKYKNSIDTPKEEIKKDLKEKFLKIKDSLSRCGNDIYEIKNRNEVINIICSFIKLKNYKEEKYEKK